MFQFSAEQSNTACKYVLADGGRMIRTNFPFFSFVEKKEEPVID